MIFFFLQKAANWFCGWKTHKVFQYLVKRSLPIYLFNQQFIYFTIIWFNGNLHPYVNALVNLIVSLAGAVMMTAILEKTALAGSLGLERKVDHLA